MYLEHFGLSAPPFRITPHPEFFFEGAHRGETLAALVYAIKAGEGLMTVSGEVGSGKTMLCRVLAERLPDTIDVVYLADPSLTPHELLLTIADDLGISFDDTRPASRVRLLQNLLVEHYAAGRQVVILIDEAHAMPDDTLEEVRLLSNLDHGHHKLMQIVLFGQPELNERLSEPGLRQLRERITYRFELGPLNPTDVPAYIDWRLRAAGYTGATPFGKAALRLIARTAAGLTRRINILADKSLLAAFADGKHEVSARHARSAIKDSGYPIRHAWWQTAALFAIASGIGIGVAYALQHIPHPTPTPVQIRPIVSAPPATTSTPVALPIEAMASAPAVSQPELPVAPPVTGAAPASSSQSATDESHGKLDTAPPGSTAIMIAAGDAAHRADIELLYERARKQLPPEQLLLLPARLNGKMGWGVFYGFFADRPAAKDAITRLPIELRKSQPFVRTAEGMKDELRTQ